MYSATLCLVHARYFGSVVVILSTFKATLLDLPFSSIFLLMVLLSDPLCCAVVWF